MIHPQAIIHESARIADDVSIGPWTIIGPNVEINSGTEIGPHVVIKKNTTIGKNNKIYQFASIGEDAQVSRPATSETYLEIGDNNIFRESVTIHRGSSLGTGKTVVGNKNFLMAYVHIAHDCRLGNNITFANNASIAGHVIVDDYAIMSGFAGAHQHCHIGAYSFSAMGSMIQKDVLPFTKVSGYYAKPFGLNVEGLRRRGFTKEAVLILWRAYKLIYRRGLTQAESIAALTELAKECPEVNLFIQALERAKRSIVR